MTPFDVVLLSCEGSETAYLNDAGPAGALDYTNKGGRVFASHYHYAWFNADRCRLSTVSPPLATWSQGTTATPDRRSGTGRARTTSDIVTTLPNGMPFPEGVVAQEVAQNIGALTNGQLPIYYSRNNATVTMANSHSQPWVTLDPSTPAPNATQYFSFDTPIGSAAPSSAGASSTPTCT